MQDNYGPSSLQTVVDSWPEIKKIIAVFGIRTKDAVKSIDTFWRAFQEFGKTSRQIKKGRVECIVRRGIMRRAYFTHDGKDKRR